MLHVITSYLQFAGGGFLNLFYALCAVYFVWKSMVYIAEACITQKTDSLRKCARLLFAVLWITLIIFILFAVVSHSIYYINSRDLDPEFIMSINHALMRADHALFGVYPPLWLQDQHNSLKPFLDATAPILVNVYMHIAVFMSLTLLLLLLFRQHLFLDMLAVTLFCVMFALPFWYFFPSFSPNEAFFIPLFDLPVADSIQNALKTYNPNPYLLEHIERDAEYVHGAKESFFLITTIPSMHGAWFAMSMYFLVRLWKPFVWIAVPLVFINAVSTLYIMQHYAVDQIAGLALAIVAILIVRSMRLQPDRHLAFVFEVIRDDVEGLKKEVRDSLARSGQASRSTVRK